MTDPTRLGRSVVVSPGGEAPPAWAGRERIQVTRVTPDLAEALHAAWRERRALTIELAPGLGLDDPDTPPPERLAGLQPWEWPVDLELTGERLHHGVWANSVDARRSDRAPIWGWAVEAVRLGAVAGGDADVILPDGRPAWCDAGPLDASLGRRLGVAVVHRVSLEHRSLNVLADDGGAGTSSAAAHRVLAPDQLAAVIEPSAGARVIAPAGSGKTRVLTERARLVVHEWGLPPAALALVAYNVRAAGEMRSRLADVGGLRIRTLNALGLRLCGRATTVEERDVRRLLADMVTFPKRAETDQAAPWLEALSRVRLGLVAPQVVEEELADVSDLDRVVREYRSELAGRDAVDFDEQVVAAIDRLLTDPAFRARSQRFARVLLMDEFQDLTPAHMLLIRLLSGPAGAVFAVGDDDQTIYGYAGATPRWLVDFERWFPGSALHSLEVNYRCPPEVVTAASNLLSRNSLRVPKAIRAASAPAYGPGGLTVARTSRGAAGGGPARISTQRIGDLLDSGTSPADVAVLSRVNSALVPVQVLLRHRGVPVDGGVGQRFLQRGGVRAALAWLELATAPGPTLPAATLREAARRPKRAFSRGLLELIGRPRRFDSLQELPGWLEGKGSARDAEKVENLVRDVAAVRVAARSGTTAEVLGVVRHQIGAGGLDASASALDQWSHGSIAAHMDDLDALTELAELEPDPARFPLWLADQMRASPEPGGVTLASIHAVKGREWPHVVLHHVTDGLIPHRLAEDLEEERRVFHVGLTRASTSVCIVAGDPPSPFLAELDGMGAPPSKKPDKTGTGRPRDAATGAGSKAGGERSARRRAGGRDPAAELLPAAIGTSFRAGGHEHTVIEVRADGIVALVGGGPARTVTKFGTIVTQGERQGLLAHPDAPQVWESLRSWRTGRAREQGVPPYVVFDDHTLRLVAAVLPINEPELLAISGIGPVKAETYGSDLMAISETVRRPSPETAP